MLEIIESVYSAGFDIWNAIVGIAMDLFRMSPKTAGSGHVYFVAQLLFLAIRNISLPIAIVFFLIAIIRETTSTPPDQQVRRFFNDALKFGVIVGVLYNLWTILGVVIDITDAITNNLAGVSFGEGYTLDMATTMHVALEGALDNSVWDLWTDLKIWEAIKELFSWLSGFIICLLGSIVFVIVTASSALSVLNSAFARIIKPLILLPFSCITVAMGAGNGDADRVMWSYWKTLIGLLISGAFMAVCVILGASLGRSMINIDGYASGRMSQIVLITVQASIIPILTAGLVKGVDGMIGKFL